jgi:hypothetical protein
MSVIMGCYAIAALFNWYIPDTGVAHRAPSKNPIFLIREFGHCCALLWRDKLGQISLATTTLFWGAGATLQFIVIDWAASHLCYNLSRAAFMQGVVAVGIALGAVLAAKFVALRNAAKVLPLGVLMGLGVISMTYVYSLQPAVLIMTLIGAFAGFFVVPMNALLQHRVIKSPQKIRRVQNFNKHRCWSCSRHAAALLRASTHRHRALRAVRRRDVVLVTWRHRIAALPATPTHLIAVSAQSRRRTARATGWSGFVVLAPANGTIAR